MRNTYKYLNIQYMFLFILNFRRFDSRFYFAERNMRIVDFIEIMIVVVIALSVSSVCKGNPVVDESRNDAAIEKRSGT